MQQLTRINIIHLNVKNVSNQYTSKQTKKMTKAVMVLEDFLRDEATHSIDCHFLTLYLEENITSWV